ncbi:MAG TPA: hypothetical protein PKI78_11210 [Anaerolineales bacterium]|nr:hypothetical protein [Anaerolineales bacterium]
MSVDIERQSLHDRARHVGTGTDSRKVFAEALSLIWKPCFIIGQPMNTPNPGRRGCWLMVQ